MRFEPVRSLSGRLRVPPDKSISHRAMLIGAMASEPVRIERYLHAADTSSTLEAIRTLGALVEVREQEVVVRGTGLREAREPEGPIDVGNAGTPVRAPRAGRADVHARRRRVDPPPAG
jgi:3-phosphoshikimate 1-carboxyvinyltransferase